MRAARTTRGTGLRIRQAGAVVLLGALFAACGSDAEIGVTLPPPAPPPPRATLTPRRTPTPGAPATPTAVSPVPATATPSATRPPTPTEPAGATPTLAPTEPPTQIPTATPPFTAPVVAIGSGEGAPGELVTIGVTLLTAGFTVAAAQNDLTFDLESTPINLVGGRADCTINPAIGPESAPGKMLSRTLTPDGRTLRAIILALDNTNPIPDGLLYTCNFRIAEGATPGIKPLVASMVITSNPEGAQVPGSTGRDGAIRVLAAP